MWLWLHAPARCLTSHPFPAQVAKWEAAGVLRRLQVVKPVFREPRAAAELETVLRRYGQVSGWVGDPA